MFSGLFDDVREFVQGVPQTQRDIRQIAQTAEQAKSPEVQQMMKEIQGELQTFAHLQIGLQVLSTVSILTIAYLTLRRGK